jgi:hypothetical protein
VCAARFSPEAEPAKRVAAAHGEDSHSSDDRVDDAALD